MKALFQSADGVPKTLASMFSILAALPLCALILMLLTHALWGTTWIDEMHEAVAYFALGAPTVTTEEARPAERRRIDRSRASNSSIWKGFGR